jgi:hypothetical protein
MQVGLIGNGWRKKAVTGSDHGVIFCDCFFVFYLFEFFLFSRTFAISWILCWSLIFADHSVWEVVSSDASVSADAASAVLSSDTSGAVSAAPFSDASGVFPVV